MPRSARHNLNCRGSKSRAKSRLMDKHGRWQTDAPHATAYSSARLADLECRWGTALAARALVGSTQMQCDRQIQVRDQDRDRCGQALGLRGRGTVRRPSAAHSEEASRQHCRCECAWWLRQSLPLGFQVRYRQWSHCYGVRTPRSAHSPCLRWLSPAPEYCESLRPAVVQPMRWIDREPIASARRCSWLAARR